MDKKCNRGIFKRLADECLDMVITIRKDSKTLQVVSNTMDKGVGQVIRRKCRDSITVKFPKDIIIYQQKYGRS